MTGRIEEKEQVVNEKIKKSMKTTIQNNHSKTNTRAHLPKLGNPIIDRTPQSQSLMMFFKHSHIIIKLQATKMHFLLLVKIKNIKMLKVTRTERWKT
jgi:hypothetical protein